MGLPYFHGVANDTTCVQASAWGHQVRMGYPIVRPFDSVKGGILVDNSVGTVRARIAGLMRVPIYAISNGRQMRVPKQVRILTIATGPGAPPAINAP
jgi:hypothetical protein